MGAAVGRVEPGAGVDVLFHASDQGRATGEANLSRILVVDDEADSRRILRDLLASIDYEVTEAVNGEQALAAVKKERPDLILMDSQMPVLDGYEATGRIKADPALKDVPIIVLTSYALSGGDEAKARAAGCCGRLELWRKSHLQRWLKRLKAIDSFH